MRAFTAGNGFDSTAAVQAYLASHDRLDLADLYLIGEVEDPNAVWLTNWGSPLSWPVYGTFQSAESIKRGKITSQVGLKVANLDVTWSPPLSAFGTSIATFNPYQKAQTGFFDNWRVRLWRCLMPTPGDANTLGATPWFGGWISSTEIGRGSIKFSVQSFLNVVNQKIPPNVIEASNAMAGFVGATPAPGDPSVATFSIVAPSSPTILTASCTGPTPGVIYSRNKFLNGYVVFMPGSTLAGYWSPVAQNVNYLQAGGGMHYNQFTVFAAFPFAPSPGDQFYVSTQWPVDLASSTAGQYKGFPYVPDPTEAI